MPPALDLAGRRFGRLSVLHRGAKDRSGAWTWTCLCDCGKRVSVRGATLVAGKTSACMTCAAVARKTTHGQSKTPLYRRWRAMLNRTQNPRTREYHNYGGRGIGVCERWLTFENFAADMGATFEPHLELDRTDVDGDYEPTNCRWVDRRAQQRNRRNNHRVHAWGTTQTVQEWAELLGIKPNTIITRLRRAWTVERALTTGADPDVLLELVNQ